jgi:hypothetical protein
MNEGGYELAGMGRFETIRLILTLSQKMSAFECQRDVKSVYVKGIHRVQPFIGGCLSRPVETDVVPTD